MKTFHYGKHTFNAEGLSIEQSIELGDARTQFDIEARKNSLLRQIKHGHDFGRDRKCGCGLTKKEYHLEDRDKQRVCSILASYPHRERLQKLDRIINEINR